MGKEIGMDMGKAMNEKVNRNTYDFEQFRRKYNQPTINTGVSLKHLGLGNSQTLQKFYEEVGAGIFEEGFLSILSIREAVSSYGGWEFWLPEGVRLFASSAFGFLAFTGGEDLWLIDTQYGQVIESDVSLADFINDLASEDAREMLHISLFQQWIQMGGKINNDMYLSPVPAIALGGVWDISACQIMNNFMYLSFTGQIFQDGGDMPAEVSLL